MTLRELLNFILLDLERTFQAYAEHNILHVKSQTWTYQ